MIGQGAGHAHADIRPAWARLVQPQEIARQGWGGLANWHWWLDPGAGIAGLLATQVLPFADPAALAAAQAVERLVYAGRG